jgi:hypothetical protein
MRKKRQNLQKKTFRASGFKPFFIGYDKLRRKFIKSCGKIEENSRK